MMFAEAVRRTHNNESVSYLFSNVPYVWPELPLPSNCSRHMTEIWDILKTSAKEPEAKFTLKPFNAH